MLTEILGYMVFLFSSFSLSLQNSTVIFIVAGLTCILAYICFFFNFLMIAVLTDLK